MRVPFVRIVMIDTKSKIAQTCDAIKRLLLDKNAKYGDSALNPTRIFSNLNQIEQLYVRIDDKLSRIARGVGLLATDEDVIDDLIGYLVLLKIALKDKDEKWDGTDIQTSAFWKTSVAQRGNSSQRLNDTEWLEMYAAGDKFA